MMNIKSPCSPDGVQSIYGKCNASSVCRLKVYNIPSFIYKVYDKGPKSLMEPKVP